jgi:hypothetical protein
MIQRNPRGVAVKDRLERFDSLLVSRTVRDDIIQL